MATEVESSPALNQEPKTEDKFDASKDTTSLKESKHPLEHKWTLYFKVSSPGKGQDWSKSLSPVWSFETVEDFWSLYNNIVQPSQLQPNCDIFVFKGDIKPEWEDEKNKQGGAWYIQTQYKQVDIDKWWLNILLAMIGEQFDEGLEICGVCLQVRKGGPRLQLWTKTASNEAVQNDIGVQLKKFLDINFEITYSTHTDKKNNSNQAKYKV